ncbi:MAG: 4-hydroxythreonine-4-phosphate dehydrogenase PdxA [Bacteroidota bacterium]
MSQQKPIIGITLGDYNGIGPEVILKALQQNALIKLCTPIIYGSNKVINFYKNQLGLKDWQLFGCQKAEMANPKATNIINCFHDHQTEIEPGKVTSEAGKAAFDCLKRATDDLKEGKIDALVTAPINKNNIQGVDFKFPGHTEYLADAFGIKDNLMFLVSDVLRVGVVTGHVPIEKVKELITKKAISSKLDLMLSSLKNDFGIQKPRIAVLGLNPHAGEEGLLGTQEKDIIGPLTKEYREKKQLVFGPFPADGFFGNTQFKQFDAVLAMYHDQGLIPFKSIAFETGVNFTAGMPAIRTSPDHGTAYDISGKNKANENSMLHAIFTAIEINNVRKNELTSS